MKTPRCIVIGGPNGAGKTTFAGDFLLRKRGIQRFINADLIAAGLSPLNPPLATVTAGRIFLAELDRISGAREDFGFESTLSGRTYVSRFEKWKQIGYRIEIIFLWLPSAELAKARVRARVRQGGHHVADVDVVRRFHRGWKNFREVYAPLADAWSVFDNSSVPSRLIQQAP